MSKCPFGSRYSKGCRCRPCTDKQTGYIKAYRRRNAEKAWGKTFPTDLVSPETCMKLIWEANGVHGRTFAEIGRICGIDRQTVSALYYGKRENVTRAMEDKIRAGLDQDFVPRGHDRNSLVDAQPYHQMIYSLHAQGWRELDLMQILREHGFNTGFFRHVKDHHQMMYRNAEAVLWLVQHIGDKRGPSPVTAKRAEQRGFFPLIHYSESGQLIVSSLLPEQRAILKRVQSEHGDSSSGRYGNGPRAGRGGNRRPRSGAS